MKWMISREGSVCFNTQPPEGGCHVGFLGAMPPAVFQHTATRRWLPDEIRSHCEKIKVSTHSHPKVAAAGMRLLVGTL